MTYENDDGSGSVSIDRKGNRWRVTWWDEFGRAWRERWFDSIQAAQFAAQFEG